LKTNDNTVAHRPNVREAGFECSAATFRARRIETKADDSVVHFKNLRWFGVPIFKIAEQACEKITDSIQRRDEVVPDAEVWFSHSEGPIGANYRTMMQFLLDTT
jgi:hypothetical protein